MTKSTSLTNRILLTILASRLHATLSASLLVLRVHGRRSGRSIELPVMYASDDESIVVVALHASQKRWWRNLREPAPVTMSVAGRERSGSARTLEHDLAARGRALRLYLQRFPRAASGLGVDLRKTISDADLGATAGDFVVVRIDLDAR